MSRFSPTIESLDPIIASSSSSIRAEDDQDEDAAQGALDDRPTVSTLEANLETQSESTETVQSTFDTDGQSQQNASEYSEGRLIHHLPNQKVVSHRDYLLHALLEERCTNEVLALYKGNPRMVRNSPEVQRQAQARYYALCKGLAAFDVVPTGLEIDQHAGTRQMYRDALNAMGQRLPSHAAPSSQRRLSGALDALTLASSISTVELGAGSANGISRSRHSFLPTPKLLEYVKDYNPIENLPTSVGDNDGGQNNPLSDVKASRYGQEFEELGVLGRGGFGTVYHVRHRLDNNAYAVKRVPVSQNRLQRIRSRGQSEIEEVLSELRTLARLDHPNIVRYYNAWVEWIDTATSQGARLSGGHEETSASVSQSAATVLSISDPQRRDDFGGSSLRAPQADSLEGPNIVFETTDSAPQTTTSQTTSAEGEIGHAAEVSRSEIHTASRTAEIILHIQMSLHPMTLSNFLMPAVDSLAKAGAAPPLAHCFHVQPSVGILLAILDAVEYLHSEGIVHRDIKPSNIFLGRKTNPRSDLGAVDLMLCNECRSQGMAAPIMLEVRIGDFGLVAVADPDAPQVKDLEPVGTELYRPLSGRANSPSLDIHALGVVAFELLWKFDTRMERVRTLQQLKHGEFPSGFVESFGVVRGAKIAECIGAMIGSCERDISIPRIRTMLAGVLSNR